MRKDRNRTKSMGPKPAPAHCRPLLRALLETLRQKVPASAFPPVPAPVGAGTANREMSAHGCALYSECPQRSFFSLLSEERISIITVF